MLRACPAAANPRARDDGFPRGRRLSVIPHDTPPSTGARIAPPGARDDRRRELGVLLVLAAVQFTHVVDFMIMMPLGPQFMRLFGIGPQRFGLLVSAYTFAAAASGFVAAFWIDRFDHKRALLVLYSGFVVATGLCGFAPDYPLLLGARVVAGTFGGVMGGLVFAIVADLVPFARRATATAIVASAFSLAAVAGVPGSLWVAAHAGWRAPFLVLAVLSTGVAFTAARFLPPLAGHVEAGVKRRPVEQLRAIFGVPNHRRAFAFTIALMFAGFTVIPFIAPYNVANVGVAEGDLPLMYLAGGLATLVTSQVIGWLADRFGKQRVFAIVAALSIAPILIVTHLPRVPLGTVIGCAVLFFVLVTGRFGPGMALVTGSATPRLRGSFLSFNASIQQLGSGLAALVAGFLIGRSPGGSLTGYGNVGWLAAGCTLLAIALAARVRVVDGSAGTPPAGGA
jgi:predicted MFS family arabinose efflux permease